MRTNRFDLMVIFRILIFLGFFNFLGRGTYIIVFACLFFLFTQKRFSLIAHPSLFMICLWVIGYVIWIINAYGLFAISRYLIPFAAFLCFMVGQNLISVEMMFDDFRSNYLIVAVAAASHGIINMFINISLYGWNFGGIRVLQDLWSSEDLLATGQAPLFLLLIAFMFNLLTFSQKYNVWIKRVLLIICILGIVYNIMSASRFILYISVVIIFLSILLYFVRNKESRKQRPLLTGVIACLICFFVYNNNFMGLRTKVEGTALFLRILRLQEAGTDTALSSHYRSEQIKTIITNLSEYIWGGCPTGLPFVHNTWLSVLNLSGVIVAIPFFLFTLSVLLIGVKQVFKCRLDYSVIVLGFIIGVYAYMYLEPLFEGARWLFFAYCFVAGMMSKIDSFQKNGFVFS